MPDASDPVPMQRIAGLWLRGIGGPLRAQVRWPAPTAGDGAPLVVLLAGDEHPPAADAFSEAGIVVVSARAIAFHDAVGVLDWAADHAAELDADPRRLMVAGGALAAAVALHARDAAWPALTRQVLVDGDLELPLRAATVAGVAPATVVTGGHDSARRYAGRLRRAGVEVEELGDAVDLARHLRRVQHRLGADADLVDPPVIPRPRRARGSRGSAARGTRGAA